MRGLNIRGKILVAVTINFLVLAIIGLVATYFIHQAGEVLKQSRSLELIDQIVSQSSLGVAVFVLVSGACAYLLGLLVSGLISSPLRKMAEASNAIAAGNLQAKIDIINSNDEVGTLSKSFYRMVENLTRLLGDVAAGSKRISDAVLQLHNGIDQVTKSAELIASSVQHVASGSEGQVRSVDEVTSAINQMSAGIQQVASNAQSVSGSSTQAYQFADYGREAIDKAAQQMESIRGTVDGSAAVIRQLGEKSQEIGNIVDLIRNIADQTNLLALNAAIEAARAGEQGRGFAVVADEVRKLAEQSADATKDISDLITAVKQETERAVKAMDLGTREAAQGTVVVGEAGNTFADIRKAVESVSRQIDEVTAAAKDMASGSNHVVKAVENIAYIAQETSGQTQNVAAAAEEQTASMEEIRYSVTALSKMAADLDGIVKEFQL